MRKDRDFKSNKAWEDFLRYNDIFGTAMKIEMLTKYNANIHYYPGDKRLKVEVFDRHTFWPQTRHIRMFDFDLSNKERADETEENLAMLLRRTLEEEGELL